MRASKFKRSRLKDVLLGIIQWFFYYSGGINLLLWFRSKRPPKEREFIIVLYHKIFDSQKDAERKRLLGGGVFTGTFYRQLRYLKKNFNIVPLDDVIQFVEGRKLIPPNALAITFDDGTKDNFQNALPILKKENVRATFFLNTANILYKDLLWIHKRKYIENDRGADALINFFNQLYPELKVDKGDWLTLKRNLKYVLDQNDRTAFLNKAFELLLPQLKLEKVAKEIYLTWDEISAMSRSGLTIGGHSRSHPVLSREDKSVVSEEVIGNKLDLEKNIGQKVDFFAYPFGEETSFNNAVISILKEAGYRCAMTNLSGTNNRFSDPFRLKRIRALEEPIYSFAYRVSDAHCIYRAIKNSLIIRKNYYESEKVT